MADTDSEISSHALVAHDAPAAPAPKSKSFGGAAWLSVSICFGALLHRLLRPLLERAPSEGACGNCDRKGYDAKLLLSEDLTVSFDHCLPRAPLSEIHAGNLTVYPIVSPLPRYVFKVCTEYVGISCIVPVFQDKAVVLVVFA